MDQPSVIIFFLDRLFPEFKMIPVGNKRILTKLGIIIQTQQIVLYHIIEFFIVVLLYLQRYFFLHV
jgi:hypothetical protein